MNTSNVIEVSSRIAGNLATRRAADELFDYVETKPQKIVILDFKLVQFATRSFTHEYLLKKKATDKKIIERNMTSAVKKMFILVKNSKDEKEPKSFTHFRSFSLSSKTL
ncbi:MAG: hypothetical protein QXL94_04690 [Candidatus Parvarchaeum sp.]